VKYLPLVVLLLAGCSTLEGMNVDVSKYTGGRVQNLDLGKASKVAGALRKSAEEISESEEYYIGRAVAAQILARYKPYDDAAANAYAQKVARAVALASDRPDTFKGYHVQLLDADEVNAFAAPGGFIFVTKGMIKLVKNEDELAGVLAHEVAHVAKKHGLKTIQTSRLTSAFAMLGTEIAKSYTPEQVSKLAGVFEGAVDDVVKNLVVNGYSRDKEYEADEFAAKYARAANYDPRALKTFLSRMGSHAASGGVFKTHPAAGQRAAELGSVAPSSDHRASPARDQRFAAAMRL
jgi:predicted Zn-dependent protease